MTIREAIKILAETGSGPLMLRIGVVKSVNWEKRICDVYLDKDDAPDLLVHGVRLRSVADDDTKGICLKPKVDSLVLVGAIANNENDCYVASYSEVDAIELELKDITLTAENGTVKLKCKKLELEADNTIINGGQLGGLIKIDALVQDLNDLKLAYNTHTHVVPTGMSDVPKSLMVNTVKSSIENEKVKH